MIWKKAELEQLTKLFEAKKDIITIAAEVGRKPTGTIMKLHELGLIKKSKDVIGYNDFVKSKDCTAKKLEMLSNMDNGLPIDKKEKKEKSSKEEESDSDGEKPKKRKTKTSLEKEIEILKKENERINLEIDTMKMLIVKLAKS